MTEEEILEIYNKLVEEYGDELPNFNHHPLQFAHYVKLYNLKNQKVKQDETIIDEAEGNTNEV